jgi:hypothetical protein
LKVNQSEEMMARRTGRLPPGSDYVLEHIRDLAKEFCPTLMITAIKRIVVSFQPSFQLSVLIPH